MAKTSNGARETVMTLLTNYTASIDADNLEAWPDYFTDACIYKITTDYNHANGLPIGVIYANNRAMLEDRVAALRKANVYEKQRYRHILSFPQATAVNDVTIEAETGFLVVRIMHDGEQDVFATGRYLDRIDLSGNRPRFSEKIVVLDSDKIDTLLAIPL